MSKKGTPPVGYLPRVDTPIYSALPRVQYEIKGESGPLAIVRAETEWRATILYWAKHGRQKFTSFRRLK